MKVSREKWRKYLKEAEENDQQLEPTEARHITLDVIVNLFHLIEGVRSRENAQHKMS